MSVLIHHQDQCPICERKILVELISNGTPHQSVAALATVGKAWAEQNPEKAKQLTTWAVAQ